MLERWANRSIAWKCQFWHSEIRRRKGSLRIVSVRVVRAMRGMAIASTAVRSSVSSVTGVSVRTT